MMVEQLVDLKKIMDNLKNIEVKLEDEDKVLLLNVFPKTYEHFTDTLLFGKEQTIPLEGWIPHLRTKS